MKYQTRADQIENTLVLLAEFEAMPSRAFAKLLDCWHCGSAACIGGWVAQHPHFQKKGVYPEYDGSPTTGDDDSLYSTNELGHLLFNDYSMFDSARPCEYGRSGKKIATRRLRDNLKRLLEDA